MCNTNCQYVDAETAWHQALQYVSRLHDHGVVVNRATLYCEYCTLLFARSQYDEVVAVLLTALSTVCQQLILVFHFTLVTSVDSIVACISDNLYLITAGN